MIDFIGSTFSTATAAWVAAFATAALGLDSAATTIGVTALLLSALAFASLIIGGIIWAVLHVRITII